MNSSSEIKQLFESYNMGMVNPFDFISLIAGHNVSCNDVFKVDCILHSRVAVYMWQNEIVKITLAD